MTDYSIFENHLWYAIPDHCREGLRRYVEVGCPVGSFLEALLSNDLCETFAKADDINSRSVRAYVMWLYNEAPAGCWGSPGNYRAWLARGGLAGHTKPPEQEEVK